MAVPEQTSCAIAKDLLIPYLAGDVRPASRAWVEDHLGGCPSCQSQLERMQQVTGAMEAPALPVPGDPGRRLVGRVRRKVIMLVAIVAGLVVLTAGLAVWSFSLIQKLADMPADMPVPPLPATAAEALQADFAPTGLHLQDTSPLADGQVVSLSTTDGRTVRIEAHKLADAKNARDAYNRWNRGFSVRMMSVETNVPSHASAKFRSGGNYYYAWRAQTWFIVIQVPESVPNPTELRDQLRDILMARFEAMAARP